MKRKHTSQMQPMPMPSFKQSTTIIRCYKCKNIYNKTDLHRIKSIKNMYYCTSCKAVYSGKLEFVG